MGILSRLFGQQRNKEPEVTPEQYSEYFIFAEAKAELGQFRISGRICDAPTEPCKTYHFIRSDLLPTAQSANELMVKKAKLYIDQNPDRIFDH